MYNSIQKLTPASCPLAVLLLGLLLLISPPALGSPTFGAMPPGWVPNPALAAGELGLAPDQAQAVRAYVKSHVENDTPAGLADLLGELGIHRFVWEDNLELTISMDPASLHPSARGYFSLVETNAGLGFGCIFTTGYFPDIDCTAELSKSDLEAIPGLLGMLTVQTPQQFVDSVWPLAWDSAWWEGVASVQTGSSRWATSCHDLRAASPNAESAGRGGAVTALGAAALSAAAASATPALYGFFVGVISPGAAAGFVAASIGTISLAVAGTVAVGLVIGGVVAYAGYKAATWAYSAGIAGGCPGCLQMQTDSLRCAVSNDTCDCFETAEDYPYGPGDVDGDHESPNPNDKDDPRPDNPDGNEWDSMPGAGCAEWVTHYGSTCQDPCDELTQSDPLTTETTDGEEDDPIEWNSCEECVSGTLGYLGTINACVGG